MAQIARDSLLTLEAYARQRKEFRARVIAHKKNRTMHLGEHVTLIFEDELTMRYQIQEMLRIEKTFEEAGIQDELDAYMPLIPDGTNLKATMMIEYDDPVRAQARTGAAEGHRGSGLRPGRRPRHRSMPSPTRTCSARTTRRLRRFTSCASSSTPPMIACVQARRGGRGRRRSSQLHGRDRRSRPRGAGRAGTGFA